MFCTTESKELADQNEVDACYSAGHKVEILDKAPEKKSSGDFPTMDTADSQPSHMEQAGHEGCDPSNPSERSHSGAEPKKKLCPGCDNGIDEDGKTCTVCGGTGDFNPYEEKKAVLSKFDKEPS